MSRNGELNRMLNGLTASEQVEALLNKLEQCELDYETERDRADEYESLLSDAESALDDMISIAERCHDTNTQEDMDIRNARSVVKTVRNRS